MKIAVTCGATSQRFLAPVEKLLRSSGHEVKRFTLRTGLVSELDALRQWGAAAIWHEWCDEFATRVHDLSGIPTVVRLHRYEADTGWPLRVRWSDRCRLVVTSEHIAKRVTAPSVVIPSIVDFDAFPLVDDDVNDTAEVAVVGYLEGRKQPGLAVAAFKALRLRPGAEPNGRLRFIGTAKEPFWPKYLEAERDLVIEPWTENVAAVWQTAGVCLSASAAEGCPYNVIEAMACGAIPLVHYYDGAGEQFPNECLWWLPQGAPMALERMIDWRAKDIREWAAERYSIDANRDTVLNLFKEMECARSSS